MNAPWGTVAHDIQERGGMDADHFIESSGTWWRVQGTETIGDRAGSSLMDEAVRSLEEARDQLAALRADPHHARYDRWEIARFESFTRVSLESTEPARGDE